MSWITRIQNISLRLITGDGKEYNPIFINASDSTPVNESLFEFIEKKGGYVSRGEIGIKQYDIELHFTGEDNIETVDEFEKSAEDKRPWTLIHPYYESVIVQPSTLNFNRNNLNDIIFKTTLYETISDSEPKPEIDVQSDILDQVEIVSEAAIENSKETTTTLTERLIGRFKAAAVTDEDFQNVINFGNEALNSISDVSLFMRSTTDLIRTPAKFYNSAKNRIRLLKDSFTELLNAATELPNYYENTATTLISAICESSILLPNDIASLQDLPELPADYKTRNDVISTINDINSISNDFFFQLSINQKAGYLPNDVLIRELLNTIAKTTGQLYILAQNSLKEKNYILPEDLTLVSLTHRLYGNIEFETIESFAEFNNLLIGEYLLIQKGREVKYFV